MPEDLGKGGVRGVLEAGIGAVGQELLDWSQRSREWITESVQREVKRQLSSVGVATRDDIDALRKRVRELERATGTKKKSAAKKSPAKRSAGKASSPKTRSESGEVPAQAVTATPATETVAVPITSSGPSEPGTDEPPSGSGLGESGGGQT